MPTSLGRSDPSAPVPPSEEDPEGVPSPDSVGMVASRVLVNCVICCDPGAEDDDAGGVSGVEAEGFEAAPLVPPAGGLEVSTGVVVLPDPPPVGGGGGITVVLVVVALTYVGLVHAPTGVQEP